MVFMGLCRRRRCPEGLCTLLDLDGIAGPERAVLHSCLSFSSCGGLGSIALIHRLQTPRRLKRMYMTLRNS
jgi:hypothetical protein